MPNAIDIARGVLRRKREDGGTDNGVVYDELGNVLMPAVSYEQPEEKKKDIVERAQEVAGRQEPVYDAMGAVAVPPQAPEGAQEGAYDRAMKKVGDAGAAIGAPIARGLQTTADDYRKNLQRHTESAGALQSQANKDAAGERGWQGRVLAPLESANAMLATGFAPVSAAATTIGHGAEWLTGNKGFGERAEFLAGFLDPSHVGMAKGALMKGASLANDFNPVAAAFVPVMKVTPELEKAKQMFNEGKSKDEIWKETMMRPGPDSHYPPAQINEHGELIYSPWEKEAQPRWFTEVSDENLKLERTPHLDPQQTAISEINVNKLKAYLAEHPEMAELYPDLWQLNQDIQVGKKFNPRGSFNSETEIAPGQWGMKLETRAQTPEEARRIVAHELNHYAAEVGGFERGNSPSNPTITDFLVSERAKAQQNYDSIRAEIKKFTDESYEAALQEFNIHPYSPEALDLYVKTKEAAMDVFRQHEPEKVALLNRSEYILDNIKDKFDMYQHMYGEATSNATEHRLDWSMDKRRENPPEFMFRTNDPNNPYRPIPEEYLYSEKELYDFLREQEAAKNAAIGNSPLVSVSESVPAEIKAPQGNLNFRASDLALKGPEKQTVQSFLDQIKTRPGFTKDSVEELAAKFPDRNAVVTKAEFESAIPQSQYNKVDLKSSHAEGSVNQHYMDEAHDMVMENLHEVLGDYMTDRLNIRRPTPELVDELYFFDHGDRKFDELPEELRKAIIAHTPAGEDPSKYTSRAIGQSISDRTQATYEAILNNAGIDTSKTGYRYQADQRLVRTSKSYSGNEIDTNSPNYFEIAITNPEQKNKYKHYSSFDPNGENGGIVSHVRGEFLPEGGSIIQRKETPQEAKSKYTGYKYFEAKPNSMVIEEIQSDVQKGIKQSGATLQAHASGFKGAIQHAIEGGAKTVYFPTAETVSVVRPGRTAKNYAPIYDQEIVKYGINPLKEIPGVSVKKVADGAYWEIDFTPEAADHILKGKGQRTPGFKSGGIVQRAMDISRFGTDAVQTAVNKARQHRRRPETPRSKQ